MKVPNKWGFVKTIILILEAAVGFVLLAAKNVAAASTISADTANVKGATGCGIDLGAVLYGVKNMVTRKRKSEDGMVALEQREDMVSFFIPCGDLL